MEEQSNFSANKILHSTVTILNLYIVFESNNWSRNPANNFPLKIVYLVQSN